MSSISERIFNVIKNSGLSYGELSLLTKIPKSALQRYATGETQKVPLDRIEKIAKATNSKPEDLLGWTNLHKENTLSTCVLIKKCHSSDIYKMVSMLLKLDDKDKGKIEERIQILLESDKYNLEKN